MQDVIDTHSSALKDLAVLVPCRPGATIYHQGARADCCYAVIKGATRQSALMPDGRRRIVSFHLAGDLFGFGTQGRHHFSAEAIGRDTVVARLPLNQLEWLSERDSRVAHEIRHATLVSISRLQQRMLLLSRPSAIEKVSGFLLEMADRSGDGSNVIILPMSRYDIADYLGVAVETVSRALTQLRERGIVQLNGVRRITVASHVLLEQCAQGGDARPRGNGASHLDSYARPAHSPRRPKNAAEQLTTVKA